MLSFEIVPSGTSQAIQIHGDEEGLLLLIDKIRRVKDTGGHLHLMSGVHLAERSPYGAPAIPEVMIDKTEFDG